MSSVVLKFGIECTGHADSSYAKSTIGHPDVAKAHVGALVVLTESAMALQSQAGGADTLAKGRDAGLQRYVMLCMQDAMRAGQLNMSAAILPDESGRKSPFESVLQPRSTPKTGGIMTTMSQFAERLAALWMVTYFLTMSKDLVSRDIYAPSFFFHLRTMTDMHVGCHPCPSKDPLYMSADDRLSSKLDDVSTFYLWGLEEDGAASPATADSPEPYGCTWVGLSIASGFYIYGILTGGHALEPVQGRPVVWLIRTLQQDLAETKQAMIAGTHNRKIWFWRLFLGAFGATNAWMLAEATGHPESSGFGSLTAYMAVREWFNREIHMWSELTGASCWEDAKDALSACVWPARSVREELAAGIWSDAMSNASQSEGHS